MNNKRLTRREFLIALAGVSAGVGLAACAPLASPVTQVPATQVPGTQMPPAQATAIRVPATATVVARKRGGTLIYGTTFAMQNTAPYPRSGNSAPMRATLFNYLVGVDDKRRPAPELTESWTLSQDRLTETFKLKQGVKFHSGREFTADDAKWNIEYAQDPKSLAQAGTQLAGIKVVAKDKYTLELNYPNPVPQIYSLLLDVPIIDPQSDISKAVGGTGPFKFDSLKPGDEFRMVRNEQYWQPGKPLLDAVVVKIIPDQSSLLVNLESGAVHVMPGVPLNQVKRIQSGAETTAQVYSGPGCLNYLVNCADAPFNDKRVRQAMSLAVDRQRFSDTQLYGLTPPTYIVWPRISPIWDASLDTGEFNLDKAKALLESAGLGKGFETTIHVSSPVPEISTFTQVFQADLAKIGVKANIVMVEANEWLALIAGSKFPGMLAHSYAGANLDPAMLFSTHPFNPERNAPRFQSDQYKQVVVAAQKEPDFDKRISMYRDITKLIKDECSILPLTARVDSFGARKSVQGFRMAILVDPAPDFSDASLS